MVVWKTLRCLCLLSLAASVAWSAGEKDTVLRQGISAPAALTSRDSNGSGVGGGGYLAFVGSPPTR